MTNQTTHMPPTLWILHLAERAVFNFVAFNKHWRFIRGRALSTARQLPIALALA